VKNLFKLIDERGKIVVGDLPKKVEIDEVIAVDQSIPESNDLGPIDVGILLPFFLGYPACRFANHFQQSYESEV